MWGTGNPKREFLHSDDLADACIYLMKNYEDSEIVNVGVGEDIAIKDLAGLVKEIVGYKGEINFNSSIPDGTPRKLVDVSKINALGWKARIPLAEGLQKLYLTFQKEFLVNQ
ncbi:GDP-L-fucose synthase [compost metagenome]